ncbi:MAG TPA: HAD family hydrolase [Vicinamibacterales bacterium]|jgi:D-glycero-D-manno-heptose 1,7-bisphosphate phosphatase|nr:HAD family hydrolase [Vicinamibacterales bacterium]
MRRAVFIDRDGVINEAIVRNGKPYPPDSIEALRLCDGVEEAVRALRAAGFLTIVATNQPDVGAGIQARETVEAMHRDLQRRLMLDDLRVCYHTDADGCACRKPKPGMLVDAAADWQVELRRSFMVGDRWRDIDAGRAAGCRTILVGGGYDERPAEGFDMRLESLLEASRWILAQGER